MLPYFIKYYATKVEFKKNQFWRTISEKYLEEFHVQICCYYLGYMLHLNILQMVVCANQGGMMLIARPLALLEDTVWTVVPPVSVTMVVFVLLLTVAVSVLPATRGIHVNNVSTGLQLQSQN